MNEPLVSVIVLTYNSEKFVLETLESIKQQTYKGIELIISDDASTDQTLRICNTWIEQNMERFIRIKIITSLTNSGIPANCNRGVKESEGKWIKFIAGDDMLFPDAINAFICEIKSDIQGIKKAYHGRVKEFVDGEDNIFKTDSWADQHLKRFNSESITARDQFEILLRHCPISATTVLLKRDLFEEIGYFDEKYPYWEDRPMWLKMTKNGIKFYFINREISKYRRHQQSVQMNTHNVLFSRTILSKDEGYKDYIIPYLPITEKLLSLYIITLRRLFLKLSGNRKTFLINTLHKTMLFIPEQWLEGIKKKYSP